MPGGADSSLQANQSPRKCGPRQRAASAGIKVLRGNRINRDQGRPDVSPSFPPASTRAGPIPTPCGAKSTHLLTIFCQSALASLALRELKQIFPVEVARASAARKRAIAISRKDAILADGKSNWQSFLTSGSGHYHRGTRSGLCQQGLVRIQAPV